MVRFIVPRCPVEANWKYSLRVARGMASMAVLFNPATLRYHEGFVRSLAGFFL